MSADTLNKKCPGTAVQPVHMLPATPEHFSSNRSRKDGLAAHCRACYAYKMREWKLKKKAKRDDYEAFVEAVAKVVEPDVIFGSDDKISINEDEVWDG